jgi:hypothetical protein
VARLAAIALVSGGLHAGLIAWLDAVDFAPPIVVEPPAPIAVEIVAPPPPQPAPAVASPSGDTTDSISSIGPKPTASSISTGRSVPERPGRSPSRHPYLDMRGGARPDLSLPKTTGEAPPATTPSTADIARNNDLGTFTAHVDKDGDVTLRDSGDFTIRWAVPTPRIIGQGITDWYRSDKGPDGKRGKQTLAGSMYGSIDSPTAGCDGVRDAACAPDRTRTILVPVFSGRFNPTDWLMRRTVGDPYASKKRAYLDATRDQRAQVRATHRAEQAKRTAELVRGNLERAWSSTTDPFKRKELLFELWDEIADANEGSSVAADARAQVIGFIRARLPQRGAGAYADSEITAFNARKQSRETFSPYE